MTNEQPPLDLDAIEATLNNFVAAYEGSAVFADRAGAALDYYIQPDTIRALVTMLRAERTTLDAVRDALRRGEWTRAMQLVEDKG